MRGADLTGGKCLAFYRDGGASYSLTAAQPRKNERETIQTIKEAAKAVTAAARGRGHRSPSRDIPKIAK